MHYSLSRTLRVFLSILCRSSRGPPPIDGFEGGLQRKNGYCGPYNQGWHERVHAKLHFSVQRSPQLRQPGNIQWENVRARQRMYGLHRVVLAISPIVPIPSCCHNSFCPVSVRPHPRNKLKIPPFMLNFCSTPLLLTQSYPFSPLAKSKSVTISNGDVKELIIDGSKIASSEPLGAPSKAWRSA
jgi:hypothetical protein